MLDTHTPIELESTVLKDIRFEQDDDAPLLAKQYISNLEMKDETNLKSKILVPEQYEYALKRKNEILHFTRETLQEMNLDEEYQEDISETFDFIFPELPSGSKLRGTRCMVEILIFHVLKKRGMIKNPDEFVRFLPIKNLPLKKRYWLLKYTQYLPPEEKDRKNASIDNYLDLLYSNPKVTTKFINKCEEIKLKVSKIYNFTRPKLVAGVVCYFAFKKVPLESIPLTRALRTMQILNPSTVYNAVKRLREKMKS